MPWFVDTSATDARRFVARALGGGDAADGDEANGVWADLSRPHAVSRVACVRWPDGREVVVKVAATTDTFRRERAAYQRIAAEALACTPRLLASDEATRTLLLSRSPGAPDVPATHPAAPELHAAAGRWLARFHRAAPLTHDPVPLSAAYRQRADRWARYARGVLDDADVGRVLSIVEGALPRLADRQRSPCHRDFSPRNWLAEQGRLTAVIDFGHARDDLAEIDFVRLASDVWTVRPGLRDAFLQAYRAEGGPADPEAPWIGALMALEALGTVVWARRHGDTAFEAKGRRMLARVLSSR